MDKTADKVVKETSCREPRAKKQYVRPELVKKDKVALVTGREES